MTTPSIAPAKSDEEAEEAREVFVVRHVADAVDEDQQADEGDHHQHDGGERIEHPAELQPLVAELEPVEVDRPARRSPARRCRRTCAKATERQQERECHRADGERGGETRAAAAGARALSPAASMGSAGISQRF